jgi:hypothetical protein
MRELSCLLEGVFQSSDIVAMQEFLQVAIQKAGPEVMWVLYPSECFLRLQISH